MKKIKYVHILMFTLIIVSSVYVGWTLKYNQNLDINSMVVASNESRPESVRGTLTLDNKDYSKFVQSLSRRKIFVQPVRKKEDDLKAKALLKAKNQLKSLKLVGVLGDDEKAIVEDTRNNSTLYAYIGDKLLDTFKVKKISSSTLTLEFEGTEFSLNL